LHDEDLRHRQDADRPPEEKIGKVKERVVHEPVLLREVLEYLNLAPGRKIIDCTLGGGGHAEAILERISPGGKLIGIDRDDEALKAALARLERFKDSVILRKGNFRDLGSILSTLGIGEFDGFLFDLGLSSLQLEAKERGFSIKLDGPLDMRMDREDPINARFIVNRLSEIELETIIRKYGEERFSKKIAKEIIRERPIETTGELADIVHRTVPGWMRRYKIDPATRTFQALRIAVNDELESLKSALPEALRYTKKGGRICVIAYHSLEDRIVKNAFRDYAKAGKAVLVTKKPIIAARQEVIDNPRSRSAKLRVLERV